MAKVRGYDLFRAFRFVAKFNGQDWIGLMGVEPGAFPGTMRVFRGVRTPTGEELAEHEPRMPAEGEAGTLAIRVYDERNSFAREYVYDFDRVGIVPGVYLNAMDSGPAMECFELYGVRLIAERDRKPTKLEDDAAIWAWFRKVGFDAAKPGEPYISRIRTVTDPECLLDEVRLVTGPHPEQQMTFRLALDLEEPKACNPCDDPAKSSAQCEPVQPGDLGPAIATVAFAPSDPDMTGNAGCDGSEDCTCTACNEAREGRAIF